MRVIALALLAAGVLAGANGDTPPRFSSQGDKERITTRADWREHRQTGVPPRTRPIAAPPLTETRVLDPNFCQPGSPQAFATAYIQLCLDPVEECPEGEVLQPARETRSRPAG